jgi:hypothetical protein
MKIKKRFFTALFLSATLLTGGCREAVTSSSEFRGVIYVNEDTKTYLTERKKLPVILLFDWNGEPLAELRLNDFITAFDIDFINGHLYTLDLDTDVFCRYDIRDMPEKLWQTDAGGLL